MPLDVGVIYNQKMHGMSGVFLKEVSMVTELGLGFCHSWLPNYLRIRLSATFSWK